MDLKPKTMKVDQLRSALKARGRDSTGKKAELVERLQAALDEELLDEAEPPANTTISPSPAQAAAPAGPVVAEADEHVSKESPKTAAAAETTVPVSEAANSILNGGGTAAAQEVKSAEKSAKDAERDAQLAAEIAKREARAKRFGIPVVITKDDMERKKRERAERFMNPEEKKRLERAKRFGIDEDSKQGRKKNQGEAKPKPEPVPVSAEEQAKRDARAARFNSSA